MANLSPVARPGFGPDSGQGRVSGRGLLPEGRRADTDEQVSGRPPGAVGGGTLTFALVCRLEEALSDCIWAQKHMRGNAVIDYRQLGLRFKLSSWQVAPPPPSLHHPGGAEQEPGCSSLHHLLTPARCSAGLV